MSTTTWVTALLLLAATQLLHAQLPDAEPESEQQTIARCIEDAGSPDDQVRLRAVMILGKYDTVITRRALVNALDDESARIRHSAAVALSEKRSLSGSVSTAMIDRIDDPDVHVRRVVSSHLPYLVMGLGNSMSLSIFNTGTVTRPSGGIRSLSDDLKKSLTDAFSDSDAVVRKNMIDNYNYLRSTVSPTALVPLLRDENRDVRSLAIDQIRRTMPISALVEEIAHLVEDPDATIRKRVAEILSDGTGHKVNELLEKLSSDADFAVSTEALFGLFTKRHAAAREELLKRLDDARMQDGVAVRVLGSLNPNEPDDESFLLKMLEHRRTAYRENALMTLLRHRHKLADERLLKCLSDSSPRVRRNAMSVARLQDGISAKSAKELVSSPYTDIRMALPTLTRGLPDKQAGPIVDELLFDEAADVRVAAVVDIVTREYGEWRDTLNTVIDVEDTQFCSRLFQRLAATRNPRIVKTLQQIAATLPADKAQLLNLSLLRYSSNRTQIFNSIRTAE